MRNTLENLVLLQRIRGYYRTLVPEAEEFFGQAAEAERSSAAMALFGLHLLYQQQRGASLVLRPPAQASSA